MEGSTNTRRIDPLADLREATEKNAQEAREEKERAEQAKEDAAKADYHNSRTASYNSHVKELAKRTVELIGSRRANATLRQQMGEAQTALHNKEERLKMEQERDRLAKQLADQADKHQAELQKLKDAEEALQAKFETHRSNWVDKEKAVSAGYG
nr:uncharacterized protein LOC109762432 [Aegilops tauschii subsp. strangulata]